MASARAWFVEGSLLVGGRGGTVRDGHSRVVPPVPAPPAPAAPLPEPPPSPPPPAPAAPPTPPEAIPTTPPAPCPPPPVPAAPPSPPAPAPPVPPPTAPPDPFGAPPPPAPTPTAFEPPEQPLAMSADQPKRENARELRMVLEPSNFGTATTTDSRPIRGRSPTEGHPPRHPRPTGVARRRVRDSSGTSRRAGFRTCLAPRVHRVVGDQRGGPGGEPSWVTVPATGIDLPPSVTVFLRGEGPPAEPDDVDAADVLHQRGARRNGRLRDAGGAVERRLHRIPRLPVGKSRCPHRLPGGRRAQTPRPLPFDRHGLEVGANQRRPASRKTPSMTGERSQTERRSLVQGATAGSRPEPSRRGPGSGWR